MITRMIGLATLALALGAACAGQGDDVGPAATPASTATTEIETFRFAPKTLRVPVGTAVTWVNRDATAHTVTAGTPDHPAVAFDRRLDGAGDLAVVTLTEPGILRYYCVIHPFMTGTIEVVAR